MIWTTAHILSFGATRLRFTGLLQSTAISVCYTFFQFHPVAARRSSFTAALHCRGLNCVTMHCIALNCSLLQLTRCNSLSKHMTSLQAVIWEVTCSYVAPGRRQVATIVFIFVIKYLMLSYLQAIWDLLAVCIHCEFQSQNIVLYANSFSSNAPSVFNTQLTLCGKQCNISPNLVYLGVTQI